jgi:hypothetical protein
MRDRPVIGDDHRSRPFEQTHNSITRSESEHILGDLEHDAGTFAADVGPWVGV